MRAAILTGAMAALLYGGSAVAQQTAPELDERGVELEQGQQEGTGGPASVIIIEGEAAPALPPPDVVGIEVSPVAPPADVVAVPELPLVPEQAEQRRGFGGAGQAGMGGQRQDAPTAQAGQGMMLFCYPHPMEATGGAGLDEREYQQRQWMEEQRREEPIGGAGMVEEKDDLRGLTLMLGAGLEGYTGELAPNVEPGAAVAVTASIKPTRVLGLEFGYSGAVNNLDADVEGSGPDLVRNGGHAALTMGLAPTSVQPYVMGGLGVSRYNIRNGQELGFQDDITANVPVGLGLRTHIGDFTADARVNYNVLLGNQFAPGVADERLRNGRYMGTVNLGGTF